MGDDSMCLDDAFGRSSIDIVFCHYEQACAMVAEAHVQISNKIQFINITTGRFSLMQVSFYKK